MSSQLQKNDASFFLRSLKDEGIDEIFLDLKKKAKIPSSAPLSSKTAVPVKVSPKSVVKEAEAGDSSGQETMLKLQEQANACTLCSEFAGTRNKVVFGSGSVKAKLMFIGEAPGRDEDEQGLPFVGAAGQLLTKIIESIQLTRDEVYIANTLKCRPPQNRPPQPDEISNCNPFLQKQIELIQPQIICALGAFAAQTVLNTQTPISKLRGKFWDFQGSTRVICTFHPAYLLRNPGEKRKVWEDMKMIKAELERLNP